MQVFCQLRSCSLSFCVQCQSFELTRVKRSMRQRHQGFNSSPGVELFDVYLTVFLLPTPATLVVALWTKHVNFQTVQIGVTRSGRLTATVRSVDSVPRLSNRSMIISFYVCGALQPSSPSLCVPDMWLWMLRGQFEGLRTATVRFMQ